ncbi:nucleolar and spindle-associated protein 1-like [Rhopilema esculentum]|uniref:nucleolar and spindle-associated protein 1-like n=1 Tax=Rhopilema esculentum TaxID=499914 RepID=UPI0031DC319A
MAMTEGELAKLKRPELQKIAKLYAVKANKKNADIIKDLLQHFSSLNEQRNNISVTPQPKTEEENPIEITINNNDNIVVQKPKLPIPEIIHNFEQPKSKKSVRIDSEITIKNVQGTKIPKLHVCQLKDEKPRSAAKDKFQRIHNRSFNKMESIDDYIKKKTDRANFLKSSVKAVASDVLDVLSTFKKSHNTPKTPRNATSSKPTHTPKTNFTPRANFMSKEKKSATSRVSTLDLSSAKSKVNSWHKDRTASRKTVFDFRSPLTKLDIPKKTPNKFDLKESLKKPLSYKPHRGKLLGMEKKYFNKENAAEPRRTDVKTMKRTQDVKREERRATMKNSRLISKQKLLDRRRGIVS